MAEPDDVSEVQELRNEVARLRTYEQLLKVPLGHLVDLLNAGKAYRRAPHDRRVLEHLSKMLDRAISVDEERNGV